MPVVSRMPWAGGFVICLLTYLCFFLRKLYSKTTLPLTHPPCLHSPPPQVQKKPSAATKRAKKGKGAMTIKKQKATKPPIPVPSVRVAKKVIATPAARTTKPHETDIKLPKGWKVEVSTRESGKSKGKSDTYYVAPDGKKCRSYKDIVEYMSSKS